MHLRSFTAACAALLCAGAAHAMQDCELNGESVNPNNYPSGKPERVEETKDGSRSERRFAEDGVLRREILWQLDGKTSSKTLEREFSERAAWCASKNGPSAAR